MPAKKRSVKQEPLLNTVARKLGHAAGRITNLTQELTENLSALPETVTTKVREAAKIGTPTERSRIRHRHAKTGIRHAARKRTAQSAAQLQKRRSPTVKSARSDRRTLRAKTTHAKK
jgi:hypothetical protein